MAKRKVRFLRYMSRPRVLLIFEIDTVAIAFFLFAISYFIISSTGAMILYSLLGAIGVSYVGVRQYAKIKENTTKGFIFHFLYTKGIWTIKEDPKKYPSLKFKDIKQIIPDGNSTEFID